MPETSSKTSATLIKVEAIDPAIFHELFQEKALKTAPVTELKLLNADHDDTSNPTNIKARVFSSKAESHPGTIGKGPSKWFMDRKMKIKNGMIGSKTYGRSMNLVKTYLDSPNTNNKENYSRQNDKPRDSKKRHKGNRDVGSNKVPVHKESDASVWLKRPRNIARKRKTEAPERGAPKIKGLKVKAPRVEEYTHVHKEQHSSSGTKRKTEASERGAPKIKALKVKAPRVEEYTHVHKGQHSSNGTKRKTEAPDREAPKIKALKDGKPRTTLRQAELSSTVNFCGLCHVSCIGTRKEGDLTPEQNQFTEDPFLNKNELNHHNSLLDLELQYEDTGPNSDDVSSYGSDDLADLIRKSGEKVGSSYSSSLVWTASSSVSSHSDESSLAPISSRESLPKSKQERFRWMKKVSSTSRDEHDKSSLTSSSFSTASSQLTSLTMTSASSSIIETSMSGSTSTGYTEVKKVPKRKSTHFNSSRFRAQNLRNY